MSLLTEAGRLGVIADISGAVLIAKAVFFKADREMYDKSGMVYGKNHHIAREGIKAKYEAIAGCTFLVIGFAGQYLGTFESSKKPRYSIDFGFGIMCAVMVGLTLVATSKYAAWRVRKLAEEEIGVK